MRRLKFANEQQALDTALKQLKCRAGIVFSQDSKNKRVVCLANVNRECVDKGLTAKAWVDRLCCIAGGYGGGKETTAQASLGTGLPVDKIKTEAEKFAKYEANLMTNCMFTKAQVPLHSKSDSPYDETTKESSARNTCQDLNA
ncbi:DHHA1 domain protein [Trichinella nativa]|uniref:DHHA1 domain protein n=1 Tax=Trichinella nativa TaxID=6335 RepID=A0A1Y3EQV0_9BILA|nr:DHHA1 domain protein [Trichinella nativa]